MTLAPGPAAPGGDATAPRPDALGAGPYQSPLRERGHAGRKPTVLRSASETRLRRAGSTPASRTMTPSTTRRVVLVARVSDAHGDQDTGSQLLQLRSAAERHGWDVVDEITLRQSAYEPRSAAEVRERILTPIEAGRADTIAVVALDRVVRGGIYIQLAFLRRLEEHLGGQLWSLNEPFLTTQEPGPMRELQVAMRAWVNRAHSDDVSRQVRAKAASLRARVANGGGRAKWGRGRLITVEDVRRIKALYDQPETTQRDVADSFGISVGLVNQVVNDRHPLCLELEVPE